jgi:uncharacterized protein YndB with AHSA1/START domain
MHSKRSKKAPPFYATLCAILLTGVAGAAEPQVTEGFVNAPVAEVWRLFTTSTGSAKTGPARVQADLRIGGEIRTHYEPEAASDRAETIVSEILAYEPERMLAFQVKQAPASFPPQAALDGLWTIVYLTPSGEDMTHVRIVGLGYSDEPASRAAREVFASGNRRMLDTIAKQYWPKCARCAAEPQAPEENPE